MILKIIKNLVIFYTITPLICFSSIVNSNSSKNLGNLTIKQNPPEHYKSDWKKDPKVLRVAILAFSSHGGHHTAAVAVKNALEALGKKCDCKIVYLHTDQEVKYGDDQWYDKTLAEDSLMKDLIVGQKNMISFSKMCFDLKDQFGNIYDAYTYFGRQMHALSSSLCQGVFTAAGVSLDNNKIYKHDWSQFDLIISVIPYVHNRIVYEIPEIKENKIPVISIPTDCDEISWGGYVSSPNIMYLLCSDAFMRRAKKMGVKEFHRISGLPLRAEFREIRNIPKEEMKEKLGFNKSKPLILVDFGAAGQEQATEILFSLSSKKDINIAFICGRSEKVKADLEKTISLIWPEGKPYKGISGQQFEKPDIRILGFVDAREKTQYMRAADLIAGKTGGLSTFEALECETPIVVLLSNILPNEKVNTELLLDYNCCKLLNCWSELPYTIEEIISEPKYREGPFKIKNFANDEIASCVDNIADNYEDWRERLWS